MRCRGGWRWHTYRGLTRCRGRSCLGFGAGNQHHSKDRKHRSKNDRFFHSVNCFFTNNSSQVASVDVLKREEFQDGIAISRSRNKGAFYGICHFVRYMSILARCFFSSARLRFDSKILLLRARGRGDLRRRAFSLAAISCARRVASACSIASNNRSRASLRFWACERESCTVMLIPLGR
jgi:hypothetical protein